MQLVHTKVVTKLRGLPVRVEALAVGAGAVALAGLGDVPLDCCLKNLVSLQDGMITDRQRPGPLQHDVHEPPHQV